MNDQLVKYAAVFEKSARRFRGFRQLRHAPKYIQDLAQAILGTNKPLGTATPFTLGGQEYLAEFAPHATQGDYSTPEDRTGAGFSAAFVYRSRSETTR
jgi:hypothetical protein